MAHWPRPMLAMSASEHVNAGDEEVDEDGDDRHQNAGNADPDGVATETLCSFVISLSHTRHRQHCVVQKSQENNYKRKRL